MGKLMTKKEKFYYQLLYWSEESIKRGILHLAPISLKIETLNLIKDTIKLMKSKKNNLELDRKLNVISDKEYNNTLQKYNIISEYLDKRLELLKRKNLLYSKVA